MNGDTDIPVAGKAKEGSEMWCERCGCDIFPGDPYYIFQHPNLRQKSDTICGTCASKRVNFRANYATVSVNCAK